MVTIIAKFAINSGKEPEFQTLINELIKSSLAEEGCVEYALQKHTEKPSVYCLVERWKDKDAVDFHNNTRHFTTIVPKLIEIANVEVDVYEAV